MRAYIVVLGCLFAANSVTALTLSYFWSLSFGWPQLVILAGPASFVAVVAISFRKQHPLLPFAGKVTSIILGFLNFAFIAALACWPTLGLVRVLTLPVTAAEIATTLMSGAMIVGFYGWYRGARLELARYTIHLPSLPSAWSGRTVALVTDMHVGLIRGPRYARRIVTLLQSLQPHAVFISGDMFDGAKIDIASAVEPWREFHPPGGTYFVTGNHDEFTDPAPYLAAIASSGVRVLHNEKIESDGLQIIGVHDALTHDPALYRRALAALQIDPQRCSLLLCHRPAHLAIAASAGISLQFSGHTHAGQFFPWTVFVRLAYGRFGFGLNSFRGLQVLTSSGAGTGGPPMRVGTRNEVVLVRLERVVPSVP